jgi:hypothetical protein
MHNSLRTLSHILIATEVQISGNFHCTHQTCNTRPTKKPLLGNSTFEATILVTGNSEPDLTMSDQFNLSHLTLITQATQPRSSLSL